MADKLDMKSMDIAQDNIAKIKALFPSAITEVMGDDGKVKLAIDFDALKQELSEDLISEKAERYQMTWPDKSKAKVLANSRITATLRPDKEKSVDFDNTENLYIEGDNLDVLKLLRETYLGKVKMIYIDPPYNTGNDFVYNDDFAMSADDYAEVSGQYDEQGNRLVVNTESNGRFHTDWLNMIYPRLKVARDLLSDDGVIFISIDENEVENLKKICDEIFGKGNFVDTLHWKKKKQPSFLAKHTAKVMEYVLVYARNAALLEKLSIETLSDATKKVINISNPECTRHFAAGVRVKIGESGVITKGRYRIKTMDVEYLSDVPYENGRTTVPVDVVARFSVSQEKINSFIKDDLLFITANSGLRRDVSEAERGERKSITDLLLSEYGDNQDSDNEFKDLFGAKYFDYTKPIKLVYNFVKSNFTNGEIVLDFFSGSATTAHAVMQLNAEDGGNRKFIMVQLPEKCDEMSEAYKAGYKNICEIGKERIRRAGKKIVDDLKVCGQERKIEGYTLLRSGYGGAYQHAEWKNNETGEIKTESRDVHEPKDFYKYYPNELDIGFRVLKLDSSNMQDVYYNPAAMTQDLLASTVDNVKADRTPLDLLFQVMLDLGVELSAKIEEHTVSSKTYYAVNENDIIACFDDDIDNDVIAAIAKQNPLYAVFKDKSFATDSVGINNEQLFKTYSPSTVVKVI